jgi:phosphoadenosine phosphosulfate reductase
MGLEQLNLETGLNKTDTAIELLKAWEPIDGYYLAFSGGKDSVAIYDLAVKARVKFDAHYCVSPIDPPQVRAFIKEHYPDVIWDFHAKGFWKMVDKNGLPTRLNRWCCRVIKEAGGTGRMVIVGNRRSEGTIRKHQCSIEAHRNPKRDLTFIRPILDFNEYDIWQYIREMNLPVCELYNQGFTRIGCVLCPFSRNVEQEERMFPKIAKLYRLAAERIVERMKAQNYTTKRGKPFKHEFKTGEELYQWWIKRD